MDFCKKGRDQANYAYHCNRYSASHEFQEIKLSVVD